MQLVQNVADELRDDGRPRVPLCHCVSQAIQQERLPSAESDVGRISARLRDKGKDYGEFWGARATGSSDRYDEFTWFIRWPAWSAILRNKFYHLLTNEQE